MNIEIRYSVCDDTHPSVPVGGLQLCRRVAWLRGCVRVVRLCRDTEAGYGYATDTKNTLASSLQSALAPCQACASCCGAVRLSLSASIAAIRPFIQWYSYPNQSPTPVTQSSQTPTLSHSATRTVRTSLHPPPLPSTPFRGHSPTAGIQ